MNSRAADESCSNQNNLKEVKMFRFGFLFRFLLALLIIGGLVAGGVAIYRLGYAQGYQTSALLSNKTTAPAAPVAPYYGYPIMPYFWPGFGFPFFFPLLGIGFFLFFFFIIGGLFRFGMHRRWAHGSGPGHWEGHGGPWGWEGREHPKEQTEKGQEAPKES